MPTLVFPAHGNNYEIIKMLLDRGAMITIPHDIKCGCEECIEAQKDDSLRFSLARINSYKALSSPSMIALSSRDPIIPGECLCYSYISPYIFLNIPLDLKITNW